MKYQFISNVSRNLVCSTIQCSILNVVTEFNNMSFLARVTHIMHVCMHVYAFGDVTAA